VSPADLRAKMAESRAVSAPATPHEQCVLCDSATDLLVFLEPDDRPGRAPDAKRRVVVCAVCEEHELEHPMDVDAFLKALLELAHNESARRRRATMRLVKS
jgi:hypothetical protein